MSVILAAALGMAVMGMATPTIDDCWQTTFKDASFTAVVDKAQFAELSKINADFSKSYRFKSAKVRVQEPFKIRVESTVDDMDIVFIVNGSTKRTRIPRAGINIKDDVSTAPGKRQTAFDFGLLTPSMFKGKNLFQARYIRTDRKTGEYVFDVTYVPSLKDETRHRIWVDPDKKVVMKREWYTQMGGYLLATFYYEGHEKQNGVWFPTTLSVKNADDKQAGVTHYKNLKVNSGLDEDIFSVR